MTTRVHGMPLDQTDGCSAGILGDKLDITGWRRDMGQIIQKRDYPAKGGTLGNYVLTGGHDDHRPY